MLLGLVFRPQLVLARHGWLTRSFSQRHDPLRILFCGSDEFSASSLKALHASAVANPQRIASIDVVCRPAKRVGRGRKKISKVPIKSVAESLKLQIHERNTFTGWKPPADTNLIVAVSFGLFVPPRILKGAKYGGLNVHPSLLPEYSIIAGNATDSHSLRGPAPIQHALLRGYTHTGVSLQTLSAEDFDQGAVLAQTPSPGLPIPNHGACTVDELQPILADIGAKLLVQGIEDEVFVEPTQLIQTGADAVYHAGKITPEMRKLSPEWESEEIMRRQRVLGPLWTMATRLNDRNSVRVVFSNLEMDNEGSHRLEDSSTEKLCPASLVSLSRTTENESPVIGIISADRHFMRIGSITVDGHEKMDPLKAIEKAKLHCKSC